MKGMDEQSDLIVLTLELKEQKYICVVLEDVTLGSCYHRDIRVKRCFLTLRVPFLYLCSTNKSTSHLVNTPITQSSTKKRIQMNEDICEAFTFIFTSILAIYRIR